MSRSLALTFVFLCLGCGPDIPDAPSVRRVVIVTIDTLRADHVGAYGYPRDTSPFIDSLADRGFLFERAFSQCGTTQPSHASLFTSLYPLQHRVMKNGYVLDESFLTLAEHFRDQGFATAGFTSTNAHFSYGKLDQGFAVYDELVEGREAGKARDYRPADETADRVLEWLREPRLDDRFLLWVHFFDPHKPLQPPEAIRQELGPRFEAGHDELGTFLAERHSLDVSEHRGLIEMIDLYDLEIAWADRQLARISKTFAEQGLDEGTLWVITGDHGQGLKTHGGYFGHSKHIYNVQLKIPLIFYFGGHEIDGRRIDHLVEHVDVAPTILDLLDLPPMPQIEPTQGVSLRPLLEGGTIEKRLSFAQRSEYPSKRRRAEEGDHKPGESFALQDRRYKFIYFADEEDELYDLEVDPYETADILAEEPTVAERFRGRVVDRIESLENGRPTQRSDAKALDKLEALGYIQ